MDAHTAESLLEVAEQASAGASGPNAKASLDQLESRLDELLAAMAWFVDMGRTDEALRLANALYRFWITKQRFAEGAACVRAGPCVAGWRRPPARPGRAQRRDDAVLDGRRRACLGALRRGARDRSPAWRCAADIAGARRARPGGVAHGRARGSPARARGTRRERRRGGRGGPLQCAPSPRRRRPDRRRSRRSPRVDDPAPGARPRDRQRLPDLVRSRQSRHGRTPARGPRRRRRARARGAGDRRSDGWQVRDAIRDERTGIHRHGTRRSSSGPRRSSARPRRSWRPSRWPGRPTSGRTTNGCSPTCPRRWARTPSSAPAPVAGRCRRARRRVRARAAGLGDLGRWRHDDRVGARGFDQS